MSFPPSVTPPARLPLLVRTWSPRALAGCAVCNMECPIHVHYNESDTEDDLYLPSVGTLTCARLPSRSCTRLCTLRSPEGQQTRTLRQWEAQKIQLPWARNDLVELQPTGLVLSDKKSHERLWQTQIEG
eukprot:56198-Eustigmatos_ZCMA.PRE.1